VKACKFGIDKRHAKFAELLKAGVGLLDVNFLYYPQMVHRILKRSWPLPSPIDCFFKAYLNYFRPSLCVIAQGENFDGVDLAEACRREGYPYLIICQKASDIVWPDNSVHAVARRAFFGAKCVYFVSHRNRELTERQLGIHLDAAKIVRNPILTSAKGPLPWPDDTPDLLRVACVARLDIKDKGQDMLLEVLAHEKWRNRAIKLTLYGEGLHSDALRNCAKMLELKNVVFAGYTADIESVWTKNHALILPSRAEGLPLTALEALACGRPCILTPVAGCVELLFGNDIGFLAPTVSVQGLDQALESAWMMRDRLPQMGVRAADSVRQFLNEDPISTLKHDIICAADRGHR
jgi:glycosyltransferase involved in cell wall biosynthesis